MRARNGTTGENRWDDGLLCHARVRDADPMAKGEEVHARWPAAFCAERGAGCATGSGVAEAQGARPDDRDTLGCARAEETHGSASGRPR